MNSSKFILLDEPFNKMPVFLCDLVIAMLKKNRINQGIIITDHNHENVIRVSARIILLEKGKLHKLKEKAAIINK